jgi:peptidoglycan/xylan/chitin deacetylase (PgdA/CDA1 family)
MKRLLKNILARLFPKQLILKRLNSKNSIALTFDDGPYPIKTERLLNVLKNAGIKTTFFISGEEAEKHPELIRKIKDAGHEIGNHGYSHKCISETQPGDYHKGIEATSRLIEQYSGTTTNLFRPPYGELNPAILKLIFNERLVYAGWTVDSQDSYLKDSIELIKSLRNTKIRSGDILLFHADYDTTIDAMPEIIVDLKARGFELVTVSELIDKKTK